MMVSSPVEGSKSLGEMIGSVIMDVGYLAISAISCFVILPAVALSVWMKYQSTGKKHRSFVEVHFPHHTYCVCEPNVIFN
jgi:hypothetical protein